MRTLLLMGGSMGYADHVKTLEVLTQIGLPLQLLVVCGNNAKMKVRVEQFAAKYEDSVSSSRMGLSTMSRS